MYAVEGSDNVGVLGIAIIVWELEECVGCDGDESAVAIYGILMGIGSPILGLGLCLGGCPEEHGTIGCPHHLNLAGLARLLGGDERHVRLQGGSAPIDVAEHHTIVADVVNSSLGIP